MPFLKLTPVLSQKSEKMHLVPTSCSSLPGKRVLWPPFFISWFYSNKDSAFFRWEQKLHKSMFSFTAILLNCTDWAITGRIARVQFNFTLERKVKTRALLRFPQTCELSSSKAACTIAFFATVNHSYDHRQRTLKNTNTQNGSKSTNHKSQTMTFWTR